MGRGQHERLSPRLGELAALVASGLLDKQIAHKMRLRPSCVKVYQTRARLATGTKNRAELAAWWVRGEKAMGNPRVSLIVSTFHRPDHLTCLLYSLKVQTFTDFEVLVADNSSDAEILERNKAIVHGMRDARFRHLTTGKNNPYPAADAIAGEARGEYLGFPSDDNYYVPGFLELMTKERADLIYCDMIYDPRYSGTWAHVDVKPSAGYIDKGGFLMRRSLFAGFPSDPTWADGHLVNQLMNRGVSHAKVPGILWVHN